MFFVIIKKLVVITKKLDLYSCQHVPGQLSVLGSVTCTRIPWSRTPVAFFVISTKLDKNTEK